MSEMASGGELVLYEASMGVAVVTLNRPDRRNAWTGRMETSYRKALQQAEADDDVRVVVVTGAGTSFSVGADTRALDGIRNSGEYDSGVREPLPIPGRSEDPDLLGRHSFLWGLSKPVIAAVNGAAAGVGFVLMCFADIRIAASGAKLTTSSARLGLPAEYGLSWLLPRLVGLSRAAELLLTSRVILAEEAERIGLVHNVHPQSEVLERSVELARQLARECAPSSLRVIKQQLYDDLRRSLAGSEAAYDRELAWMVTTEDFSEGVGALIGRRPPDFLAPRRS
jgi:enoyl-CoA hydratase/carnithine racemase